MVQEDLTRQPNMDEVVSRFAEMKKKLGSWKLQVGSWMARSIELWPVTAWRSVAHWYHTIGFVLTCKEYYWTCSSCVPFEVVSVRVNAEKQMKADKWKYKHDGTEAESDDEDSHASGDSDADEDEI
ncbi:hypothetical protein EI94DRAFT_1907262 [Lactarius quietus]|nr:hypothetical protein EI94DRAFT_1907262 [Lactarius quietus]